MSQIHGLSAHPLLRQILRWRFLRFATVGTSGTLINLCVLYLAHDHLFNAVDSPELRLNLSLAPAIFLATLHNFLWNRAWTWRDRRDGHRDRSLLVQFGQYALAGWTTTAMQVVFTNALVLFFPYLIANAQAIALCAVFNFVVNDRWTFRRRTVRGIRRP